MLRARHESHRAFLKTSPEHPVDWPAIRHYLLQLRKKNTLGVLQNVLVVNFHIWYFDIWLYAHSGIYYRSPLTRSSTENYWCATSSQQFQSKQNFLISFELAKIVTLSVQNYGDCKYCMEPCTVHLHA